MTRSSSTAGRPGHHWGPARPGPPRLNSRKTAARPRSPARAALTAGPGRARSWTTPPEPRSFPGLSPHLEKADAGTMGAVVPAGARGATGAVVPGGEGRGGSCSPGLRGAGRGGSCSPGGRRGRPAGRRRRRRRRSGHGAARTPGAGGPRRPRQRQSPGSRGSVETDPLLSAAWRNLRGRQPEPPGWGGPAAQQPNPSQVRSSVGSFSPAVWAVAVGKQRASGAAVSCREV